MIRINLLGVAAPPPKAAPGAPAPAGMLVGLVALGTLLVAGGAVGGTYLLWRGDLKLAKAEEQKQVQRQRELADIAAKNKQYQAQIAELTRRTDIIEQLQNSRVGPSDLMNHLADAVSRTHDVWLAAVTPSGTRVGMNGQAYSVDSIARFMSALEGTGSFPDVHLQEYAQTGPTTFRFALDCAYKLPTPPAPPATPGPAPAGAAPHKAGM